MQATWSKNIDSLTYVVDHTEEEEVEVDAGVCGKILWPAAV
jgi:hypothetical protein